MRNPLRPFATLGGLALLLCGVSRADALVYTLDSFTDNSVKARLEITQQTANSVQFNLQVVPNPNIGDLRGFFLNISDDSRLGGLSVFGTDITQSVFGPAGTVSNLGGGNSINPEGPFDIGLVIGTAGIGSDDIQNTTFTISSAASLPVSLFTTQTDPVTGGGAKPAAVRRPYDQCRSARRPAQRQQQTRHCDPVLPRPELSPLERTGTGRDGPDDRGWRE